MAHRTLLDTTKMGKDAELLQWGMAAKIVGQESAIHKIVEAYQTYIACMCEPSRPVGSFLFLGPTGSGKTHTVETLADCLVGNKKAVIKIDCAEFQHSHEIAKLIGSPPGYLGHRETHAILTQSTINGYHTEKVKLSFLLFDEIEKASDALWNLLLGVLDKAVLTLGDNSKVDFSSTMVFLTSNLGAREMEKMAGTGWGFAKQTIPSSSALNRVGVDAARKRFTPEFMNRIDTTVVFEQLTEQQLRQVLDMEIKSVDARISTVYNTGNSPAFALSVTESARQFLLTNGYDPKYGARHIKRAINTYLVAPLSNLLASRQVMSGDLITADVGENTLIFCRESRKKAVA